MVVKHSILNLDAGNSSDLSKFADDTEIGWVTRSDHDVGIL